MLKVFSISVLSANCLLPTRNHICLRFSVSAFNRFPYNIRLGNSSLIINFIIVMFKKLKACDLTSVNRFFFCRHGRSTTTSKRNTRAITSLSLFSKNVSGTTCLFTDTEQRLHYFPAILDHGDVICRRAAPSALLRLCLSLSPELITGDSYDTQNCFFHNKVKRHNNHWYLFVFKTLRGKSSSYIISMLHWSTLNSLQ